MIILVLVLLGLACGSFVNALVWRLHKQAGQNRPSDKYSITRGRSMCVNCGYQLSPTDLVPLFSWVSLKGKCRYCKKPISVQYPLVEIITAFSFIMSYIFWPNTLQGMEWSVFGLWLITLTGLMALIIYDLKWMLLPNKIVYFLYIIGLVLFFVRVGQSQSPTAINEMFWAVIIGGGLFYLLFQISNGKWIGGGDVKLGFLLGFLAATPTKALLMLFLASLLGCLWILPLMLMKKINKNSRIPFGPFLIISAIIIVLFGQAIINWYNQNLLYY